MFATLLLPNFFLQAIARHQPELREQPLAVLDDQAKKAVILQLNDAAATAGVVAGMTPSQGLARSLALVIKARAREREAQVTDILLHHAFLLSPFVEETAPGVCTVRFTNTTQLEEKVRHVIASLTQCDVEAHGGIAANPDASLLAAHLAEPVLAVNDARKFFAPLPLETLRVY